jgi:hypothetical protein
MNVTDISTLLLGAGRNKEQPILTGRARTDPGKQHENERPKNK